MKKTERIDGREYVVGSREHQIALNRVFERARRRITGMEGLEHLDANQVAFLARDLVYVSRDVQRVLYDALKAAYFIPVVSEIPAGADAWIYEQQDAHGEAQIGADLDADDLPEADVATEEFAFRLINVTSAYSYSVQDLERAALSGRPLARDKANACAEVIARGLDKIGRVGKPEMGIFGFFNNPNVPVLTLPNGEWLTTATPAEIIEDLQAIEQAVITNSRDNYQVEELVLPTAYEGKLRNTSLNTTSDTTIAEFFFGGNGRTGTARMLKRLERWIALDDASGTDIAVPDGPQGIAYSKRPEVVRWDVPITYQEFPPQPKNFKWKVPARARTAGVTFKRPNNALYIENLD